MSGQRRKMEYEGCLKTLLDHNKIHIDGLDIIVETRRVFGELVEYRCTIVFDLVAFQGVPREALIRYHHEKSGTEDYYFLVEPTELVHEKAVIGEKIKIFERILQI